MVMRKYHNPLIRSFQHLLKLSKSRCDLSSANQLPDLGDDLNRVTVALLCDGSLKLFENSTLFTHEVGLVNYSR